jgi:hypothetical protein
LTARAVQNLRKQRKLFTIRKNSASCSTFGKAAQAVHRSRKQRKLLTRTSTSGGSSS